MVYLCVSVYLSVCALWVYRCPSRPVEGTTFLEPELQAIVSYPV